MEMGQVDRLFAKKREWDYKVRTLNQPLFKVVADRVSFETSFDSKLPKLESTGTETSFGTIRNKTFFPGCFAFSSKQQVSMFRLNRKIEWD